MTYPLAVHTHWQYSLVAGWLAGVAYKPGTTLTTDYHEQLGTIMVHIEALLFDSTHPGATKVIRNQSIRMPMMTARVALADWDASTDYYDYGPDLMAGPLLRISKSVELSMVVDLPTPETPRAAYPTHRDRFLRWLRHELHDLEAHESDEWFRDAQTGQPFFDPHASQ
jgi:hypothetical protein